MDRIFQPISFVQYLELVAGVVQNGKLVVQFLKPLKSVVDLYYTMFRVVALN